jgi:hypothetical protein
VYWYCLISSDRFSDTENNMEKILGKYKVVDTPEGIEVFNTENNSTQGVWNTHDMDYFTSEEEIDFELDELMEFENRGEGYQY